MFNETENSKEVICPIYYENHFYGGAMPQITTFTNIDFGDIRVVYLNGAPYFCLRDVCVALEFENVDAFMSYIIKEIDKKCSNSKCLFIVENKNKDTVNQTNMDILKYVDDNYLKELGNNVYNVYRSR